MNTRNILIALAVSGTLTLGVASPTDNIEAQIEAIKKADPNKRVELMNKFKQELMQMNAEDRQEALSKMRSEMQEHQNNMQDSHMEMEMESSHENEMEMDHQNGSNMQEHATEIESHMQDEHDMIQNNFQNQAGNEVGHEIEREGGTIEHGEMEGNYQNFDTDRDH